MKLFDRFKGKSKPQTGSRRDFLQMLGLGAVWTGLAGMGFQWFRSLVTNVLYESPLRFKVGTPVNFNEGMTFLEDKRLYVFKERNTFYAISAACTHLGCTVKYLQLNNPKKGKVGDEVKEFKSEFQCPCHGSKFYGDGTNYAGPAPRPLRYMKLEIAPEDGQLVVNMEKEVAQNFRLTV